MSVGTSRPPLRRRLELALSDTPLKAALRPFYHALNRRRFRAAMARNARLQNRCRGRCFILLTGPSLDEAPFAALENEAIIGGALACKHPGFSRLKNVVAYAEIEPVQNLTAANIDFDVWCDGAGIELTPDSAPAYAANLYRDVPQLLAAKAGARQTAHEFFAVIDRSCPSAGTVFLLNAANQRFLERSRLFTGRDVYWVATTQPPFRAGQPVTIDLANGVNCTSGISFFSLALALYLGFREIYLVGWGYTTEPRQEFHFYDLPRMRATAGREQAESAFRALAASRGVELAAVDDRDGVFTPQFVRGLPVDARHEQFKAFATGLGARIHNIVPHGYRSPTYDACSWADVGLTG